MTSSRITPITAASDGDSTTGRRSTERQHGLAVLRKDEAKALISLACEAISQTHSVGHELHTLIYGADGESRPGRLDCLLTEALACWEPPTTTCECSAASWPTTTPSRTAPRAAQRRSSKRRAWRAPTLQPGQPHKPNP
jgi:hypothetical protein